LAERTLLRLDNVTKSFGGITAVKGLSFEIMEGEILGVIGPNGAGKTTVFNLISGVFKPSSGTIEFCGNKISGLRPHSLARIGISRTFQSVKPFGRMTVLENVAIGGLFGRDHALSVNQARREAREILTYVSLEKKADLLAGSLTLAEQRRLELARALAAKPRLLMLDEVMAGLNYADIRLTLDLLQKLSSEKAIALLVIEHVMKAIVRLCGRILVMDYGEKITEGSPSEVMKNEAVLAAYMGEKRSFVKSESKIEPNLDTSSSPGG
jgi:branched-chain amino acid transport system ATP-binding protein